MKISGMDYGRPRRAFQIARYARQVFRELESSFFLFLLKVRALLHIYIYFSIENNFDIILQRKVKFSINGSITEED